MRKPLIVAVMTIWALVLVGAGMIAVLLVTGDGQREIDASAVDDFYGQEIDWAECGENQCGTLTVPLSYDDPGGETIEINVEKAPATGKRVGSLVVNPGGPGAPGTQVATDASFYFDDPILTSFDVVGFDPRGTGASSPLDCLTDDQLDTMVASDPDPDTPEEVEGFVELSETFWTGCDAKSGDLGAHVSTVEAARDMDVLRSALGEDQLDYFGFSYGTRLGATYAELFPDQVGQFVLDGAIDPSLTSREGSLSQAQGFERALRSYVQDCVDKGDCYLGDSVDAGLATISGLLDQIDAEPLPTNEPERPLEIGLAFYGLITPLYNQDYWPYLDDGLGQALNGNGSVLLALADLYGSREDGTYTDNSLEAISVINCLDDPWSISADEVPAQYADFEAASPTLGRVFAWGLTACHGTPFTATDEPDLQIDGSGAAPIVVLGTTRDPATPYEEAVALADQLESGVLVSRDGDGHTAYNKGNACVDDAVHAYLLEGVVPEDGLEC